MVRKRNFLNLVFVALSVFACSILSDQTNGAASDGTDVANEAFNLRMAGKADEAKGLLEKALADNPENAAAHYELARTKFHMLLGNPGENLADALGDAQQSVEKAMQNDPDNVIYPLFTGHVSFLQAYLQGMTGNESAAEQHADEACEFFGAILKLKPDYYQAMVYLVEINSMVENRDKAVEYERQLAKMTGAPEAKPEVKIYHAKARSILFPDECGVDFWKDTVLKDCPKNPDVLEELGKAYLGEEKVDDAVRCFEQAIAIDPEKSYLFLDLSIYHTFRAIRAGNNKELLQESIKSGDAAVTRYIDSKPIQPMLAYALGVQSKYKSRSGDKELAKTLVNKANALDPYFSKATAAPTPDLFIPPDKVSENHRYLARPF
jgi:tetratricopeptide (TPR) repeat protein